MRNNQAIHLSPFTADELKTLERLITSTENYMVGDDGYLVYIEHLCWLLSAGIKEVGDKDALARVTSHMASLIAFLDKLHHVTDNFNELLAVRQKVQHALKSNGIIL